MDPKSVRFMAREILILRRLNHPNVMKLEGLVISKVSGNLCLVFEYMEHDLAGLIASPTIKFSEPQVCALPLHLGCPLDINYSKGSASIVLSNASVLKKDLQICRLILWAEHIPPELLLGATDYGVAVDLWSAGCILAELYARKPIMPGRTEVLTQFERWNNCIEYSNFVAPHLMNIGKKQNCLMQPSFLIVCL
ncbi:hypothetical protein HYC85_028672 [Camellia sinensis]|uniref:Protein kinase domain-containing protein n=1 Tax=Camellia sinensis TaxID=4442 RepID=A0A7J7FWZ3_CAMSI|nr:hypothetical protein HYC85_028672 [Camellia sinensis]